jgi:hypothetical protein
MPDMNEEIAKGEFIHWWMDSYGRLPGDHAIMTHVAFAMHLFKTLGKGEQESGGKEK